MKIYIYNPNDERFQSFVNNDLKGISGIERDEKINDFITKIGNEITPKEFQDNAYHYTSPWNNDKFRFLGEPENVVEKLLKFIYGSASYIHMKSSFPEDFCESRTDWDDMVDYADEMSSFIEDILNDLIYKE